jgi:polysaccharide biosynthesis protein VpsQ
MKTKIVAILFLAFIFLLIIAADAGRIPPFIHAIYDFPGGDKLGHFILYGILAFLLARAFPKPVQPLGRFIIPMVILALLIFAATEEFSQSFFSTRTFDLVDLTFSFLGILTGNWLAAPRKK